MKACVYLFLLMSTGLLSWADGLIYPPQTGATQPDQKARAVYDDFKSRLEAAVASRDPASVTALYRTNDVSMLELKAELDRWAAVIKEGGKPWPPYLKILNQLPPKSHEYWESTAHRLTRHQVTAFALVRFQSVQMTLPLVLVEDKLLIVPSDKISARYVEPGSAARDNQPFLSETNSASSAAGSRR